MQAAYARLAKCEAQIASIEAKVNEAKQVQATSFYEQPHENSSIVEKYRRDAERGDAEAQNRLGLCYDNGTNGVQENNVEAVKWFRKAAEQGHAAAQYNLGMCYESGEGVAQAKAAAVKWYRKAAEQGLEAAKEALTRLGVEK